MERLVLTWLTTITTSGDEVDEFSKGVLPDDVVGGKADLVGDGVLVGSKVTVKVGLDVCRPSGPVDGGSTNDKFSSQVKTEGVEGNSVEDKAGDGNLVSDDVDKEGGTSLNAKATGLDASVSSSSEVSLWNGLSAEWAGINVAFSFVGGGYIDCCEFKLENSSEEESIDVYVVVEGGQSSGDDISTDASFQKLGDGIKSDINAVWSWALKWVIDGTSWSFSLDFLFLHCNPGKGACNEEEGNEENLHDERVFVVDFAR